MDPRQTRKVTAKVEIIREGRSMRKMRLSDIMSEGFSTYLMKLDGDFIAPTGARLSSILEAPTDDQIKARAGQIWQRKGSPEQSGEQMRDDYLSAKSELEDEEEIADAQSKFSPTNPDNQTIALDSQEHMQGAQQPAQDISSQQVQHQPAADPNADNDNVDDNDNAGAPAADPDPGKPGSDGADSSTVDNSAVDDSETNNDEAPPPAKPGDSDAAVSTQDETQASDELGGPDEFDEKNRAFTNYIDNLIKNKTGAGGGDSLPSVSERVTIRSRSLVEAVYGSQEIHIVDYKRNR